MQYTTDNVGFTYKTYGETLYCIDFPTISINFIRICGDFPVNSKVITCNAKLFFFMQYLLVPKVRNYGDFRQSPSQSAPTILIYQVDLIFF